MCGQPQDRLPSQQLPSADFRWSASFRPCIICFGPGLGALTHTNTHMDMRVYTYKHTHKHTRIHRFMAINVSAAMMLYKNVMG